MQKQTILHVGIDDTDSEKGMCTTYLAYKIVNYLRKERVDFLDLPRLIRFNPNIPWKTRGNGAVGFQIRTDKTQKIKGKIRQFILNYSDTKNGANPGLVFYERDKVPNEITQFSEIALWKLVNRRYAKEFAKKNQMESYHLGNGQGLVGAIGVIGYQFDDFTVELLSYRKRSNFGKQRKISKQSVKKMQRKTFPNTFNSFDHKKNRILISSHGPDPVFYGIRGEDPATLFDASKLIKTREKPEGFMVFRSNQGTSAHLKNELDVSNLRPYQSGTITGVVLKQPQMEEGGHVFFSINSKGKEIRCAVYEPTKLGPKIMGLISGDNVKVGGGVRKATKYNPQVLNVEFLKVLELVRDIRKVNPRCTKCNKRMKSKGKRQGFECIKCGNKADKKEPEEFQRTIKKQLYLPAVTAHRHLTRPLQRIGVKNKEAKFDNSFPWFCVFN